jgi:hypothetical protein
MAIVRAFGWGLPAGLALAVTGVAQGDEIDNRLKGIAAFVEGRTADSRVLAGLATMKPEERLDCMKRAVSIPPPARALLLFEMAKGGQAEAVAELDALLKQHASLTGKLKNVSDVLELRELAWDGREKGRPEIQALAAGLLLAYKGIPQDNTGLARMLKLLTGRPPNKRAENQEVREAAIYVGYLHLRGVGGSESQKELERSMQAKEDEQLRMNAAAFVAVTGNPRAARLLLDAMGGAETYVPNLERITRVLISGGNFTEKQRVGFVPDLVKIVQTAELPERNRQYARLIAGKITGQAKVEDMVEWAAKREKELADAPATPDEKPRGPDAQTPKTVPPKTPDTATPKPPPPPGVDPECAKWLLLAKNFMNMKNYEKAEEHLKRVIEKTPQGNQADEAREMMKQIEAVKGL